MCRPEFGPSVHSHRVRVTFNLKHASVRYTPLIPRGVGSRVARACGEYARRQT